MSAFVLVHSSIRIMLDTGQIALGKGALALFRQGLAAAAKNCFEEAVCFYDQVLELQADCFEVWYERGLALEAQGNYREAIANYDRALSLTNSRDCVCEIWHNRGNAFQYGLGDYTQAIACYDQALKLHPDHEIIWQNRGNALLYGLSLPEDALACYKRALAINSNNVLALRNQGNALVELRRYDEAIASYDRALEIKPDDQISWHARSLAAEKTGLKDRQPTTNPAWLNSGFDGDPTFVEGDSDSTVIFASKHTATSELIPGGQGQPMLMIEDDWGRREVLLEREQYIIGRDPKADICLHSQFVSRQHAVLTRQTKLDGTVAYHIVDGNPSGKASTNGLLINGQKSKKAVLHPNTVIVFAPKVVATYQLLPDYSA